jgi:DNA-binding CsgD family transcriptional regulator
MLQSKIPAAQQLDRLIQTFYTLAVEEDWQDFRHIALHTLCNWLGAVAADWLTQSEPNVPGEYTDYPRADGRRREELVRLEFPAAARELALAPLPGGLLPDASLSATAGYALRYEHRGGALTSTVLLCFASELPTDLPSLHRAVGHMVEAAALSLRQYIQRDDWLFALGRANRGTAALVDTKGTVYSASRRFRDLLANEAAVERDFPRLPFPLPDSAFSETSAFMWQRLHFRVAPVGALLQLHARRPLPLDGLSPREQQIARALGNGKTFKSVARQYDIAVSTVANHASRIYRKLGIYRREDLVELLRARKQDDSAEPAATER